ncbi:MAG: rhodanese-like domain-containing protein [Planctomycetes bacterium]|nr:rhodanese-like domain-containing protein [Planctomycetota bacterium]
MRTLLIPAIILSCFAGLQAADANAPAEAPKAGCAACADCPEFKAIALADLKQAIADKKVTLLDANGSESFAKGRLPGAIDFEASKADLAKVLPADKGALIVAYCGGPKCGAWKGAAAAAAKLGYTNVQHFAGGLSGWKEAGEQLTVAAK